MSSNIEIFNSDTQEASEFPYSEAGVRAGFPAPVPDNSLLSLDLNRELIRHPAATFFARVIGDSMIEAGVEEGDLLVIDRALEPQDGNMAVCFLDGEFTLKYIRLDEKEKGVIRLVPANDHFPEIKITRDNDFTVWGIVTYTIKNRLKR